MKTSRLFAILLLFISVIAKAQDKDTYPFAERDSTLYLDVYRPVIQRADKAAVIAVFGGGFVTGARDNKYQRSLADSLTQRGFTVISIDYRLGLKDTLMVKEKSGLTKATGLFQYCIDIATEDCADAIAWVFDHAKDLNIDANKIILTGSSAGAITVLQLDYCRANNLPLAANLPKDWKPAAVISYSGGVMCRKSELKYDTPPAPTLLLHGTKDKIVAYKQFGMPFSSKLFGSHRIDQVMKKQEAPHWILRYEGIGHEVASWFPGSVDVFCCFSNMVLNKRSSNLDATTSDAVLKPTEWTDMSLFELYRK